MMDGTSNTVMFAERYRYCNPSWGGHTDPVWAASVWYTPNSLWALGMFGWNNQPFLSVAWGWGAGNQPSYTSNGNGGGGNIPFQVAPLPTACNWYVTQSGHTGTMNVTLGDGSLSLNFAVDKHDDVVLRLHAERWYAPRTRLVTDPECDPRQRAAPQNNGAAFFLAGRARL